MNATEVLLNDFATSSFQDTADPTLERFDMSLNLAVQATEEELLLALRAVDISVPARTEHRTTRHTETWAICRLLSTLAAAGRLSYPVALTHRDRADFLLERQNATVGIEVTEAIPEHYAAYCALAEREFPEMVLEPAHFRWGARRLAVHEMRDLLRQNQLTSPGWVGDRPEQEWAQFIKGVLVAKLEKLARPEFRRFDRNWLSVYDNLPLPSINLAKAVAYLQPLLEDLWSHTPGFDTLFVEHGPVIAEITAHSSTHLVLNDLWD